MDDSASKANQLEKRLIKFASDILCLSARLPTTVQGRHVCTQILRSGTSTAANYGEARAAESRADFVHKLKIVSKELNETTVWLELIAESSLISPEYLVAIVAENRELCRITGGIDKGGAGRNGLISHPISFQDSRHLEDSPFNVNCPLSLCTLSLCTWKLVDGRLVFLRSNETTVFGSNSLLRVR
jgi:four helix bundle protein